jgi:heme-degrading monooxygenase HmoA
VKKPGYAVIFSYTYGEDLEGYAEMDALTLELARQVPGYLGYESAKQADRSIFISYWESMAAIDIWRHNAVHLQAKAQGTRWYAWYNSMICKVETAHFYPQKDAMNVKS